MIVKHGLGQYDDEGNLITPVSGGAGSDTTTTLGYPNMPGSTPPGFNWSPVLANLLNQGVQLAGKVVAPTTTIQRGPNGQVLISTPSSTAGASSLLAAGSGTTITSSGNWLWIGALVFGGLLLYKIAR